MKNEVKYVFETTVGIVKRRRKWSWFLSTFPDKEKRIAAIDSGYFEFLDDYYETVPLEEVKLFVLFDEE